MYARIYFHIPQYSVDTEPVLAIASQCAFSTKVGRGYIEMTEYLIRRNKEFDAQKAAEFPDGFLYFSHTMELYPEGNPIDVTNRILAAFWKAGIPAVCACDDEELLTEKGGYRSRNIPWVQILPD